MSVSPPETPGSLTNPGFDQTRVQPGTGYGVGRRLIYVLRDLLFGASALCLAVLVILWDVGVFGGNVRTVTSHRVYRSAQLTDGTLEQALKSDKIATVINLRGAETDAAWYHNETNVCRALGVSHVDIALSATHLPPPEQMRKLLRAFDQARYPVILHCMGGADRTGLAATLYLNVYQHVPLNRAEGEELTLRYGHVRWSKSRAMDWFFDLYRRTSSGMDLRHWILQKYPSVFKEQINP